MSRTEILFLLDTKGQLPICADAGGYPLFYVGDSDRVLCPTCANRNTEEVHMVQVNWENAFLTCDDCSDYIDSAYADRDLLEEE